MRPCAPGVLRSRLRRLFRQRPLRLRLLRRRGLGQLRLLRVRRPRRRAGIPARAGSGSHRVMGQGIPELPS